MSEALPIPTSADDVDAEWLTAALASTGAADCTISAVTAEPVGVGVGLVGALARLTPTYEDGTGPETIIAKFPAATEASRFVAEVLGMYGKEVNFYTELSARAALPHATCYYADLDPASQDFVLLLSDLSAGRIVDQLVGCSRDEAETAIDALADFHAGFWNDESLVDNGWLGALSDSPFPEAIAMSFDAAWEPVQDRFGHHLTPEVKAFGDRYSQLLPDIVARLSEPPFTLSHGDYRVDNFFFDVDTPGDLAVCDFQLVDRSRGARDLAYFLTQSAAPDLRAQLDKPAVERYVRRLESHGISDYPLDRAWDDYRLATAFAFAYPVVAGGGLDHADERSTVLTGDMFARCVRAITELDSLATL